MTQQLQLRPFATREAWLAARGIGGHAAAAIRGRSPFAGPWDVWCDFQPEVQRRHFDAELLAEGLRYEPIVAGEFEHATGHRVERVANAVMFHPEHPWATGSPDAFVNDRAGGLELKTSRVGGWGPFETTIEFYEPAADHVVPAVFLDQVYWYLHLSGLPVWYVAAWIPRPFLFPELRWYRILRDEHHQAAIFAEVAAWRQKHLVDGVMPEIDDTDGCRTYHTRQPGPGHKRLRDANEREGELIALLMDARGRRDRADSEARRFEAELTQWFGDDTYAIRLPGSGIRCTRSRGHFTIRHPRS